MGRDAQLQRRLPPCVYDERPRLPVGLAVGAADQAPRACDSAHGLTGKECAISRLVAPGSRVTSEPDPTTVSHSAPFIRSEPCVCRRVRGWDLEFESGLLQRRVRCEPDLLDQGHRHRDRRSRPAARCRANQLAARQIRYNHDEGRAPGASNALAEGGAYPTLVTEVQNPGRIGRSQTRA